MKKASILTKALNLIVLTTLCSFMLVPSLIKKIDNILLLEKAHPGYWEYLSDSTAKVIYVNPNIDIAGGHGNQLVLNYRYYFPNTVNLSVAGDGTIKMDGFIDGESQYIHLTSNYYIAPGRYVLSLGKGLDWSNMYAYLEHYDSVGNKIRITSLNSDEVEFIIDKYIDIDLILCLSEGNIKQSLTPSIMYAEDNKTVEPASFDTAIIGGEYDKVVIHHIKSNAISQVDLKIFENYIKHVGVKDGWISVIDENGYGTQFFPDGIQVTGNMDSLGRVI